MNFKHGKVSLAPFLGPILRSTTIEINTVLSRSGIWYLVVRIWHAERYKCIFSLCLSLCLLLALAFAVYY